MDFTAIDFETANHRRDSACQLGIVEVRGGEIANRQVWLIRPRPFYFSPRNIDVHGIRPEKVTNQPEFQELWKIFLPLLQGPCLVAHNAPFDIGVLLACLRTHEHPIPNLHFTCTRLVARAAWPGQTGYGLKKLSDRLGIRFQHHDALEDAVACAKILLAAAAKTNAQNVAELEHHLKLARGVATATDYRGAKRATPARSKSRPAITRPFQVQEAAATYTPEIDIQRLLVRAAFLRRLEGKQLVFVGRLRLLSREHAEQLATTLGATVKDQLSSHTDVVILNEASQISRIDDQQEHFNRQTAMALKAQGQVIELLTEIEFLGLVQHTPSQPPRPFRPLLGPGHQATSGQSSF